ncbi:methylated-DNA--[protein]-cysteine S-methyltransferase [Pseudomonas sp. WHRI 8519]|uniref:methylated-DNA--[protein]-cysteine S-methyltransferase n=1 Tax=Pseudomonas sp. WHRI 8519 TaxID=3162567 RepID=UPI0032EBB6D5
MSSAFTLMQSPVGTLTLVARGECLAAVLWEQERENRVRLGEVHRDDEKPILRQAAGQLDEYFAGKRQRFELALDFAGTAFQRQVWAALLTIPFGQTRSYSDIARQIGNPSAVRAVGAANGRNPISIIAPCHRVIGASGSLTGFAGGIPTKQYLLALEGQQSQAWDF